VRVPEEAATNGIIRHEETERALVAAFMRANCFTMVVHRRRAPELDRTGLIPL
jgi:hypothetical protein